MSISEFIAPSDEEWCDAIGLETQPVNEEETVRRLVSTTESGQELELTYSLLENSVYLCWKAGERTLVEIFRESARRIVVYSSHGEAHMSIELDSEGLRGKLNVQLLPEIRIKDEMIFI